VGIETRKNGTSYYYRKVRANGHVRSEYVGSGDVAQLSYALDRLDREQHQLERAERRQRAEAERAVERAAWGLLAEAQQLAALAMLATGHHRHRGQWRKRRERPMGITGSHQRLMEEQARAELARRQAKRATERAALPPLPPAGDYSSEAITAIMARADRTDASAEDVAALQALLVARGERVKASNPMRLALDRELAEMQTTALNREFMGLDLVRRRAALGYDGAPALEIPLIDHLLLCEVRLSTIEQHYTGKWSGGGLNTEAARFWEYRLSAAQARYLRAVESLARVRRVRVELARVLPDGSAQAVAVERLGA